MAPLRSLRTPRGDHRVGRTLACAWPLLAGAVTAVGLVGAQSLYGVIGTAVIFVGSAMFAMVMVYATFAESGVKGVPVLRIGLGGGLGLVVLLGLVSLFPIGGWIVALVVALTSPVVVGWLSRRRQHRRGEPAAPAPTRVVPDQALVDRAFAQIVAGLEKDDSWPDAS